MDKNLWATTVWNSGDTLSEANCWKYYQRWNNYWFPRTWTVTTSSTQVDASTYWPWNYYSSSTFITRSSSPYRWDTTDNWNLRWWVTWVVTLDNVISNTGVLSVNGQTWNVTIPTPEESNTKTFYLSSTSDLTTAQSAYDWYVAGKNPIVILSGENYIYESSSSTQFKLKKLRTEAGTSGSITQIRQYFMTFTLSSWTVTAVSSGTYSTITSVLSTTVNYSPSYTPTYDGSPATKKYVDDSVSVVSGDSGTTYTIKVSNSDPTSWTASNIITLVP